MAEVIGTDLKFESVFGSPFWRRHHPGVEDQEVKFLFLGQEFGGTSSHAVEGIKIQVQNMNTTCVKKIAKRLLGLFEVTCGDVDRGTCRVDCASRFDPDAGGATGDERDPSNKLSFGFLIFDNLESGGASVSRARGG
ncbi:hypothetical protein CaCOL14_004669 [Colletotrichum acutatum]